MSILSQARLVNMPPRRPRIVWAPVIPVVAHLRESGWEWRQIHAWLVTSRNIPPCAFSSFRIVASRLLSRIKTTTTQKP